MITGPGSKNFSGITFDKQAVAACLGLRELHCLLQKEGIESVMRARILHQDCIGSGTLQPSNIGTARFNRNPIVGDAVEQAYWLSSDLVVTPIGYVAERDVLGEAPLPRSCARPRQLSEKAHVILRADGEPKSFSGGQQGWLLRQLVGEGPKAFRASAACSTRERTGIIATEIAIELDGTSRDGNG